MATDNNNRNGCEGQVAAASMGVEDIIAEMKANMTRMQNDMETRTISMQNEMNKMKTQNLSMQHEIDGMKGRQSEIDELKKTAYDLTKDNKFLKAKCSSLERSIKILIDEQKWEYSAPKIPRSHWIESGFEDGYIQLMEDFLAQIKQDTCDLRAGETHSFDSWISFGDSDSDIVLLHDDLLLPHWKEFANALQLNQEEAPLKIAIYNLQLSASVIGLLVPVLKHDAIESIDLQNNSFVNIREGIEFAVEVMESNERMETFYWTSNTINS